MMPEPTVEELQLAVALAVEEASGVAGHLEAGTVEYWEDVLRWLLEDIWLIGSFRKKATAVHFVRFVEQARAELAGRGYRYQIGQTVWVPRWGAPTSSARMGTVFARWRPEYAEGLGEPTYRVSPSMPGWDKEERESNVYATKAECIARKHEEVS